MAMSNAERQKRFRDRQKAKAACSARGPDTASLVAALAKHHAAWGLEQPGDAAPAVERELIGLVRLTLRSELLLGYPYDHPDRPVPEIDSALRNVINHLLALLGITVDDLPNPSPADILSYFPNGLDRQRLAVATAGRDWERYARGEVSSPLTLHDRLALYLHRTTFDPVT